MYLWRKTVTERWLKSGSDWLNDWPPERVAIVSRAGFKRLTIEITGSSAAEGRQLRLRHGGTVVALKRDWLRQFSKAQRRRPLRIGTRLIILDGSVPGRVGETPTLPGTLVIPSGSAFGTGDHATTAMTLRLLEKATQYRPIGWSLADLGTGSGILSLAAAEFGASRIEAIDNDPVAIATAKENARRNAIRGISFALQDVKQWRPRKKFDLVVANLFSQLLIGAMPKMRRSLNTGGCFIFSGVMRSEERAVTRAVKKSGMRLDLVRRRGKWIALLGGLAGTRPSIRPST